MRIPFAALVLALLAMPVLAASPKVEAAIKTIRAVAADPDLQKTFCALVKIADKGGDPQFEAAIKGYLKRLGPNFESAWDVVDDLDENSPDGRVVSAVLEELEDKCP